MLRVENIEDLDIAKQVATLAIKENERLHTRLAELTAEVANLKGEVSAELLELELLPLKEQMAALQKKLFAASSERRPRRTDDEVWSPAPPSGPRRQRKLAIQEVVHELPEADLACDCCGQPRIEWVGQAEETEEVDVVERQFVLKKHKRTKYRCKCGSSPVTAPGALRLPCGGRYSLDFAIEVGDAKHHQHLPTDRQVRVMRTEGLDVTSGTLWEQTERLSRVLNPAHAALRDYVVESPLVHADETPWRMLYRGTKKLGVWSILRHDAVQYRIDPSRGHKVIVDLLEGFDGVLVADGYRAYETAAGVLDGKIDVAICWAHARRRFVDAEPDQRAATEALDLMGNLFLIERDLPTWAVIGDDALRATALAQIREVRQEQSKPMVEELASWARAQRTLPKGKLGEALSSLDTYWEGLSRFLDDPRVPITNNAAERSLRGIVVGRKNHHGSKSVRGTEVAALFYSLIESAKLYRVQPKAYLRAAAKAAILGEEPLLPHAFKRSMA